MTPLLTWSTNDLTDPHDMPPHSSLVEHLRDALLIEGHQLVVPPCNNAHTLIDDPHNRCSAWLCPRVHCIIARYHSLRCQPQLTNTIKVALLQPSHIVVLAAAYGATISATHSGAALAATLNSDATIAYEQGKLTTVRPLPPSTIAPHGASATYIVAILDWASDHHWL